MNMDGEMGVKRLSNLDLVKLCDNFPYDPDTPNQFYKLHLPHDPRPHGYLYPENVHRMPWTPAFHLDHTNKRITLHHDPTSDPDPSTFCTAAFATLINTAITQNTFSCLQPSTELFPILGSPYPVHLDRFAADLLGLTARGAHLTLYTPRPLRIWVPRRSPSSFTFPGKLDSTVAGGVPATESPHQNLLREAHEEASLPAHLIPTAPTNVLTYMSSAVKGADERYVVPDVVYVYDLEVGPEVVPAPRDGEVKEFLLMGVEEVRGALGRGEFKTNSAVVMVDFLLRHGLLEEEGEEELVEIVQRMHRRLPFPTTPT